MDQGLITLKPNWVISAEEQRLFNTLLATIETYKLGTVLRVAGGWVRDKLLGGSNDDIDIALDNMKGSEFATHVNNYLTSKGFETHHIGVTGANPDQSKHLETAKTLILGVWVDFVNLRSESYTEHSRIPDIKIGTPLEDAMRRDLTINSLFYNVNTGQVEDWTGLGLADLRARLIRTPLDPLITFKDDPLRVLRVIRFAARFQFHVVPNTFLAVNHEYSLKRKISRERICKELLGMLKGPRPELAVAYLTDLNLFDTVFDVPTSMNAPIEMYSFRGTQALRQCVRLGKLLQTAKIDGLEALPFDEDSKRELYLAAILLPCTDRTYTTPKKKVEPACVHIMMESLKMTAKDTKAVSILLETHKQFLSFVISTTPPTRKQLGLVLRKTGDLWRQSLFLSILEQLPPMLAPASQQQADHEPALLNFPLVRTAFNIIHLVQTHNLIGAWDLKPLLDGPQVIAALGLKNPGPLVGIATNLLIEHQLEVPTLTPDDATFWITSNAAAFKQIHDNTLRSKQPRKK